MKNVKELDTALHLFKRLREGRWLRGVELETSHYVATGVPKKGDVFPDRTRFVDDASYWSFSFVIVTAPSSFGIIWRCLREKRMHARTRRSHAPKPKLGAICIVSWRGREPSRMPRTSPHRQRRRTPNASTCTFGHSSARSNRRDAAREASCTSMASFVSDLPTAVSLPRDQPRTALCTEKPQRSRLPVAVVDRRK
jgi:hypothetical protein